MVTENFLRLNFSPKSGITPGTNDLIAMSCDQILARYTLVISGVTTTGLRLPAQNQLTSSATTPTIITIAISAIAETTATGGGNITADGGATVTDRGICWSTSPNPTISNSHTHDSSGTGSFSSSITGLTANTTYYVRAYATNSAGTAYGSSESFVSTSVSNSGYGKLYNQHAVNDARGIAASGWHVPTRAELDALITALGGTSVAGGHLKKTGTTHWKTPNTSADNSSGFNSVGAGIRDASIEGFIQEWQEIWASDSRVLAVITYNSAGAYTGGNVPAARGCSVRLIKNDATLAGYTGNDGKTYTTVKIGTQVWMAENSRETKYANGNDIPQVTNYDTWDALATGAWCWFNNNSGYE
ncbi:MAG: FISUMP domain-containing protein [Chloroflexota bacterium]